MKLLLPVLLSLTTLSLRALEAPPGGQEIGGELKAHAGAPNVKAEALDPGWRLTITQPDPAKAYSAQFSVPCNAPILKSEPVLAVIKARVTGPAETGVLTAKLQGVPPPYTSLASTTELEIHREWREFPVTFSTTEGADAGKASVVLLCSQQEQTIEIESIRVVQYPAGTDVSKFPRIRRTYAGREADASWRKKALENIEKHRKADLALTLTDGDGLPLKETEVRVTLQRHEFGFGSAVPAGRLVEDSDNGRHFRDIVDRLFSIVVFENDLKDGQWAPDLDAEKRAQRNAELDLAFDWLKARHIPVRGHYLMQVATPYNFHGITDVEDIRRWILGSVTERLDFVKDRVREWDVINHPIAWQGADMLNAKPGLEEIDREVFKLARTRTSLPFFVNEDQIFREGPQQERTFEYIQELNKTGLTIAGLGNQAHFHESNLPSPEHLLAITDRYEQIVPTQSITEFDIVTTEDEGLAADYTRDVLIACFSHPAYSSFLFWGFWEGNHWKPEAASWNKDWSIRARGEVLEEWLGRRWRTNLLLKTDAEGRVAWRGFPGDYEVTVQAADGPSSTRVSLLKQTANAQAKLQVTPAK